MVMPQAMLLNCNCSYGLVTVSAARGVACGIWTPMLHCDEAAQGLELSSRGCTRVVNGRGEERVPAS